MVDECDQGHLIQPVAKLGNDLSGPEGKEIFREKDFSDTYHDQKMPFIMWYKARRTMEPASGFEPLT